MSALITRSDDERLNISMQYWSKTLLHDSLRAALAAKENLESQLCRARELLRGTEKFVNDKIRLENPSYDMPPEPATRWDHEAAMVCAAIQDELAIAAFECPHEEEAKRLRRELSVAVASAKAMVSNEMVARLEIIYKEEVVGCAEHEMAIMARFMEDFRSLARENREALDDILRRRADAGRQEGHDATP